MCVIYITLQQKHLNKTTLQCKWIQSKDMYRYKIHRSMSKYISLSYEKIFVYNKQNSSTKQIKMLNGNINWKYAAMNLKLSKWDFKDICIQIDIHTSKVTVNYITDLNIRWFIIAVTPAVLISILASSLIARFMGPTWGPSGADKTQVCLMLAPWTLLSGLWCNTLISASTGKLAASWLVTLICCLWNNMEHLIECTLNLKTNEKFIEIYWLGAQHMTHI